MEDLDPFNESHPLVQQQMSSIQPKSSESYTHFLSKSFIILLVLVLLPFFPSQAPEFINKTIFTKFWELFHLFVIGTAVSYGLFSRRNVKSDSMTQSSIDSSRTYLSGISHVSSFFEDGFQNSYGFDEKKMVQAWDFDESSVLDECKDYRSLKLQNGFENPNVFDEKNVTQAWNSQYFIGEPMVFVANGNFVVDTWGNPRLGNGYKPLKLPVRSLRSRIADTGTSYETKSENGFSLILKGSDGIDKNNKVQVRGLVPVNLQERFKDTVVPSPIRWGSRSGRMELREEVSRVVDTATSYETKNERCFSSTLKGSNGIDKSNEVKIRGLVPINLEEKLKETVVPSPIRWGSRSRRMELSGEVGNVKPPSHSKPPSVGEIEFECPKSPVSSSVPTPTIVSTEVGNVKPPSHSRPPSVGEIEFECPKSPVSSSVPTPTIVSTEAPNSEIEGFKRKENLQGSFSPASQPSLAPLNGKTSFNRSNRSRFSIDSSIEVNANKFSEKKGFGKSEKELLSRENKGVDSLNSDVKPATLVKGLTRGKSVRTIRSNDKFVELRKREEVCSSHVDEQGRNKCDKVESGSLKNYGNSTLPESDNVLKMEFENLQVSSSEEETRPDIANDTQLECDEVDKKAGEFIAKFREQIRLQRVASMKGLNR